MKLLARVAGILAATAVIVALAACPPAPARLAEPMRDPALVRGALHVHTIRSDGTGSVDDVAAAAAAAGLDFVVFTDHGDATRPPEAPAYRHGVLCLDAVEISTTGGHLVALGLDAAPYPLAGEPRDVVEDVRRLGGWSLAAHPGSPKEELRWRDADVRVDAVEWLNADSEWRDESVPALLRAAAGSLLRPPGALAMLLDRPVAALRQWDAHAAARRTIGVAAHDAHARIGARGEWDPDGDGWSLPLPSYETAFRTFAQRVRLASPLSGDAGADAVALLDGIRAGHTYTVVDALAAPASLQWEARADGRRAEGGDALPVADAVEFTARLTPAPGLTLVLLRNGIVVRTAAGNTLAHRAARDDASGAWRLEGHLSDAPGAPPVPWVVANPIFVGLPVPRGAAPLPPARETHAVPDEAKAEAWFVEHHSQSSGDVQAVEREGARWMAFDWRLAPGRPSGQFVALATAVPPGRLQPGDRVAFVAEADRPMRLSVQLRYADDPEARWRRSVYVDTTPREMVLPLDEFRPVGGGRLDPALVRSLLFVVDTVNTAPGAAGTVRLGAVRWERP